MNGSRTVSLLRNSTLVTAVNLLLHIQK
uniref:Uncharacterized protein n=1 Tax=Schistosoma japonicum TaxID=6182 RepID=Q5C2X5_SCHJA|nr:unknown [Schistosoma japonicum]